MNTIDLIKLAQGALILTPNERLNRRLHKLYGEQMAAQNHRVWGSPPIISIANWFRQLYQEAAESGLITQLLLSDIQYQTFGQKLGGHFFQKEEFIEPKKTIIEMLSARKLLKQWQVNYEKHLFSETDCTKESTLFKKFITHLDKELVQKNQFSEDELPDKLREVRLEKLLSIKKIVVFSFDEITPQYKAFFATLEQKAIIVDYIDWRTYDSERVTHSLVSQEKEYYAMAAWAKKQLVAGYKNIGCIVPDLSHSRTLIARIFYETFHPDTLFSFHAMSTSFNISGGSPLSHLPMFEALFTFLSLFQEQANYDTISQIILSPFLAFAETEKFARIKLDLKLRNSVLQTLHYSDIPSNLMTEHAPILAEIWEKLSYHDPAKKKMSPSTWINWLTETIKMIGWPGERTLNSYEYQQLQQGYTVFNDLITLDNFCNDLTFSQFIQLLKETTDNLPFQIKTSDAPIQVLGMLEASGNLFDSIWIAGLTDKAWPPAVKANPYIPFELQRRLKMPHGSSQRQYDYSLSMMQGWVRSSPDVHFSYANIEGDEPLSPSPLLSEFSSTVAPANAPDWCLPLQLMTLREMETFDESPHIPCLSTVETSFSSSLFDQQINCPFQAFAIQRLKSQEFKMPQASWDPRLRGKNLHAVMEKLWKRWQHSKTLIALSEDELNQHIDEAVTAVLKKNLFSLYKKSHDYFKLEKGRFITIIHDWILLEKTRKPFKVAEVEYSQSCTYIVKDALKNTHIIKLNLRIDRIDLTDAGEWILIDYKTNEQKISEWLNPLSKPQMPLYATQFKHVFDGIAYACLHPASQKMHFTGLSREEHLLPNIKKFEYIKDTEITSWKALSDYWQEKLYATATDFINGNAAIQPRTPESCHYCHLSTLCRIHDK